MLPGGLAALMAPTNDRRCARSSASGSGATGSGAGCPSRYDIPDIREPGRKSIAANPGLLNYASATGKAFHRSVLDGLRFEGRVLGDQAWTIRALLRAGEGVEVIPETVFEWWRPDADAPTGITATSRASARGASEIARKAIAAFQAVALEIDLRIAEEPTRRALKRVYFERLMRQDLTGQVVKAVQRRDPEAAALFDAIGAFFRSLPRPVMVGSELALEASSCGYQRATG